MMMGAEALARWHHPVAGLLEAGSFIELAEDSGLILELGEWVLTEACRQAGAWQRERPDQPLTIRVNLSARQIAQPDLVDQVVAALSGAGIDASSLCLEITETALMSDPAAGLKVLQDLRSLGVELAIDDFGTGYSSLSYLKRFPVDVLKIDRSFVDGLGERPRRHRHRDRHHQPRPRPRVCAWWPRGSRPAASSTSCADWAATGPRASCSPGPGPPRCCGTSGRPTRWAAT